MERIESGTRLALKNILFLTDFSEPSEVAIPYAVAIAREYEAEIHALHVLTPIPLAYADPLAAGAAVEGMEGSAESEMQRLDSRLAGTPHNVRIVRGVSVWSSVESVLHEEHIDLVILGTHGRTGAMKLLLGSVSEEIFRRSPAPVLTIGPYVRKGAHSGGKFRCVLFATDFSPEGNAAAGFAISMAEENESRLLLLHVMRDPDPKPAEKTPQESVAGAMHQLYELIPESAQFWCRPEPLVRYGSPAERILEVANEQNSDLIILGVRDAAGRLGAATHLERTTAHKIVAHATCPVLTVRR